MESKVYKPTRNTLINWLVRTVYICMGCMTIGLIFDIPYLAMVSIPIGAGSFAWFIGEMVESD